MAPIHLAAALLLAGTALASAPAARAQDSGSAAARPLTAGCTGGAASDPTAYAYGRTACRAAAEPGSPAPDRLCTSPYRGTRGLLYSDRTPYYAPGGEAYSYSGYGSRYSPYVSDGAAAWPAGSAGVAATTSPPTCASPTNAAAASGTASARLAPLDLATLPLPAPASLQRGTDLREPDLWLIQTRAGPIVQRIQPDGRRTFTPGPVTTGNGATIWRPWDTQDRPAVDYAWQSFASWWTAQGRAWPPT